MRSEEQFTNYVQSAKTIALSLEIPSQFPQITSMRSRKRKRFYIDECPETILEPEQKFKVDFYYKILDQAISSITERFEQLKEYNNIFSFLNNIGECSKNVGLGASCRNLQRVLTFEESKDLDGAELHQELLLLSPLVKQGSSAFEVLNYIFKSNFEDLLPNAVIALQILNTLPVTVASGDRSFSKLKLIKNYLRTTMTQERLVDLSIMAIEKELVKSLDYDDLVTEFAKTKARKVNLLQ